MENRLESGTLEVVLHRDPESLGELDMVRQCEYATSGCDVVLDFASVEVFRSQMVVGLLVLDALLKQSGHTLTLRSVGPSIRTVFEEVGLAHLFCLPAPFPREDV